MIKHEFTQTSVTYFHSLSNSSNKSSYPYGFIHFVNIVMDVGWIV